MLSSIYRVFYDFITELMIMYRIIYLSKPRLFSQTNDFGNL
jgi:hypothetical protein